MIDILTTFDDGCAMMSVVKRCVLVSPYDNIYPIQFRNRFVGGQFDMGKCQDEITIVMIVKKVDAATSMIHRVLKYHLVV
jgi:hypothetical protein